MIATIVIDKTEKVSNRATNGVRRGRLTTASDTLRETMESLLEVDGETKALIEAWMSRIHRLQELEYARHRAVEMAERRVHNAVTDLAIAKAEDAEMEDITNGLWADMTAHLSEVDRRRLHDVREAHRLGVDVHPEWLAAALAEVKA